VLSVWAFALISSTHNVKLLTVGDKWTYIGS
jgi:hypothetical protein